MNYLNDLMGFPLHLTTLIYESASSDVRFFFLKMFSMVDQLTKLWYGGCSLLSKIEQNTLNGVKLLSC